MYWICATPECNERASTDGTGTKAHVLRAPSDVHLIHDPDLSAVTKKDVAKHIKDQVDQNLVVKPAVAASVAVRRHFFSYSIRVRTRRESNAASFQLLHVPDEELGGAQSNDAMREILKRRRR